MMRKETLFAFFALVLFLPSFVLAFGQSDNDQIYVSVQTMLRNSDGKLVVYLESSKFSYVDFQALKSFLDYEISVENDPVITIDGKKYVLVQRMQQITYDSDSVIASTSLHDSFEGKTILLARFVHDGYPIIAGDELTSIWTFLRPL